MTAFLDVALSTIKIDEQSGIVRDPPRKKEDRQNNYLELFDFYTVFSDIYQTPAGIELLGPPLLNLKEFLVEGSLFIDGNCVEFPQLRDKNRISKSFINVHGGQTISFENKVLLESRLIQPNLSSFFKNKNVLVTQQKNNSLSWIAFWLAFHVQYHAVDAVIIYDNSSDQYSNSDIKKVVSLFPEIKIATVVNWDIPWGPTGGHNSIWDSDYGQHQSWEHAYSRFLLEANCAIYGDIDEFPVTTGGQSLPSLLQKSGKPVLSYPRRQIVEVAHPKLDDFGLNLPCNTGYYQKGKDRIAPKYTFNPKYLTYESSLMAHQVLKAETYHSTDVLSRHMGSMRVNWRNGNFESIKLRPHSDFENLEWDFELQRAFDCMDMNWVDLFKKVIF